MSCTQLAKLSCAEVTKMVQSGQTTCWHLLPILCNKEQPPSVVPVAAAADFLKQRVTAYINHLGAVVLNNTAKLAPSATVVEASPQPEKNLLTLDGHMALIAVFCLIAIILFVEQVALRVPSSNSMHSRERVDGGRDKIPVKTEHNAQDRVNAKVQTSLEEVNELDVSPPLSVQPPCAFASQFDAIHRAELALTADGDEHTTEHIDSTAQDEDTPEHIESTAQEEWCTVEVATAEIGDGAYDFGVPW